MTRRGSAVGRRGSDSSHDITGLLDLRMAHSEVVSDNASRCAPCPRSWDVTWSDLGLLLKGKFRDFRFRKERRMFDMVDTSHTGYVTLDEIIQFRDKLHVENPNGDTEMLDVHKEQTAPDISKSLLALYHFDVALDGHFTFEEFLLLQAYLQDVEHDNDGAAVCNCIRKNWLKPTWWRRRFKHFYHKIKKCNCKRETNGPEGPEEEQPLAGADAQAHSKRVIRFEGEERVITRKVNDHGELHEIIYEDAEASVNSNGISDEDGQSGMGSVEEQGGSLVATPQGRTSSVHSQSKWGSSVGSPSDSDDGEEEEEDPEFLAAMEERKQNRRAMLVQSLKSNKGRKRFIDWLYRLADTTASDNITKGELLTFLKAIRADGINPEVFVDPSEDCGDADDMSLGTPGADGVPQSPAQDNSFYHEEAVTWPTSPTETGVGSPKRSVSRNLGLRLDKQHPNYLDIVGSRIMMRYNESKNGSLSREEFMQLATMVEREYELSHNDFSAAERVGPYRFIRTLGRGAEGVVKLAINTDDESVGKRAIKIIKRGNIASLSRIDREVEAMVLLDHPTVVTCWEVLETESNICLVVEYCAGGHIGDYISPTRPMTESAARFYFTQLIDGLSYCHEHCVCHRDLRIENLMLDNKGDLKITDFGHAGIFQQGWDVFSTMMVGSVSHLAPEQVLGTVYSGEKIDMWSVGVILYLMVTGTAPFRGDTVEDLLDNIKLAKWEPIEDQGKQVSPDCLEIMEQTLRVDYKERPGCQQIKVMPFMKGSREKLVLAHCEFFISKPQANAAKFLDLIKGCIEDADTMVRDPKTTHHSTGDGEEEEGEEEVEATVRTVWDDEDIQRAHSSGMRPVSVTMFHCIHSTHSLVFKVTVTMLSSDGGLTKLYPLVEFDLQSGEAAMFQRVFRKVRSRFNKDLDAQHSGNMGFKAVHDLTPDLQDEEVPLAAFAAATGLNRNPSYAKIVKPDGKCQEGFLNGSFRGSCHYLNRTGSGKDDNTTLRP